jgi:hypothetical protein
MITDNLIEEIIDLSMRVRQEEADLTNIFSLSPRELLEEKLRLLQELGPEWYEFD